MSGQERATDLQRQASDPRASAWVNANAGSGKTHVLVDRVIRLILAGTAPSRILCLTFTKAAAAEMSNRVFRRLASWVRAGDEELTKQLAKLGVTAAGGELLLQARRLFATTQETPGGLKIQTIHAFCERLLQLFPIEAGIVPHFNVLDDAQARDLRAASRDAVLMRGTAAPETPLGAALSHVTSLVSQDQFDDLLEQMLASSENWYEPRNWQATIGGIANELAAHFGRETQQSIRQSLGIDAGAYRRAHVILSNGGKRANDLAAKIADLLNRADASLLDCNDIYLNADGDRRSFGNLFGKNQNADQLSLLEFIATEQQRLITGLGKLADLERIAGTEALLTIAAHILHDYEARKRQLALYDFSDLIQRTRSLLAERPDAAWVLYKLDGGIDHVLIDEAQDTSPAQWDIVQSLTEEFFAGAGTRPEALRTVFAVGDRKQSIFSFQGADPDVFEIVRHEFSSKARGAGLDFNTVDFTVSFRSAPEVLQAVDLVFGQESPARRGLNGRDATDIQHQSTRSGDRGIVELWPLIEPDEKDEPQPWTAPVDLEPANAPPRKLARQIAATLKRWIGKRCIGNSQRVLAPGDILILVRHRKSFFDMLISELRQAGIPVAGADRLKLRDSIAVRDLLALATFAVLPEDDLSLACLLKSPLMAKPLDEGELFDLCHGRGEQSVWQRLKQTVQHQAAAGQLSAWRSRAAELPPYEFFASVLQQRRVAFVERLGFEVNDALDALLQAALDHGRDRAPSLASFLAWFGQGDIDIKRNMEPGRDEVRVMTVHGAKGLEAPIVILPDTTGVPETGSRPKLYAIPTGNGRRTLPFWAVAKLRSSERLDVLKSGSKDAEFEEYHRLLYVAMTRARDELYVCGYRGTRDAKDGNWHQRVKEALEQCQDIKRLTEGILRLGVDPCEVAAQALASSTSPVLPGWIDRPVKVARVAPSRSVTSLAAENIESATSLPGGRERGLLIHRLLQILPETPEAERALLAHQIVTRAAQPLALAGEVLALLSQPAMAPLLDPDGLSEVALTASLPEIGQEVTGRIDRLFIGASTITIADYKTDRSWPRSLDQVPVAYLRQLALYRKVMENAYPGRTVTCLLVWTAAPAVMEVPSSFLDQALAHLMAART